MTCFHQKQEADVVMVGGGGCVRRDEDMEVPSEGSSCLRVFNIDKWSMNPIRGQAPEIPIACHCYYIVVIAAGGWSIPRCTWFAKCFCLSCVSRLLPGRCSSLQR